MTDQNIVIFGAGKIGRSFIGQLFGHAGYEVVFVDMDVSLVNELNKRGSYPVVIKGPESEDRLVIKRVRAIHALEGNAVVEAIRNAGILAISVGKNALPAVASLVGEGLTKRQQSFPGRVLDIILAENMRSANIFFRNKLRELLPSSYPLDELVGLVETSIGKMVPMMTTRDLEEDPLQVFAEPYNTLILDRKGFRGEIPQIEDLSLKDNVKAWVDRKAFIHNLGHASAAFAGHLRYPESIYMHEILSDKKIREFTRIVMRESAVILRSVYPGEYSEIELSLHIDDLITRFQNRNLGDTIFRVGSDLQRKLGPDDRFMAPIRMAIEKNAPYGKILEAMAMGFLFKARDQNKQMFPGDVDFHRRVSENPELVLEQISGLNPSDDGKLISQLKELRNRAGSGALH
jgi:mannitol-1-phosphate 5-dehydrogenase